ncbi:hypothetical protein J3R30DRAFT_3711768 [Lentinula aciculospora]|uniref:Uncharacterized protein n=1 Tax=Lentinula aciculospora TaxID=153920 RepID=A0A9W9DH74_9AGAR|nr:hypothetical protein J3R30DRAFT_3711768 [Lentinula aciculospora]
MSAPPIDLFRLKSTGSICDHYSRATAPILRRCRSIPAQESLSPLLLNARHDAVTVHLQRRLLESPTDPQLGQRAVIDGRTYLSSKLQMVHLEPRITSYPAGKQD